MIGRLGASPVAIKQSYIDPPVFVARPKCNAIGLMEQVGIKDQSPILAIGNANRLSIAFSEEGAHRRFISIVLIEIPIERRLFIPDDKAAGFRIFRRVVWRYPEIDIHRCEVGVQIDTRQFTVIFECPGLV